MEKFKFDGISGCYWPIEDKKGIVIISHGMAEHIERYDWFAKQLNKEKYEVWGINQLGHGDAIVDGIKGHWEKNGFYDCVDNLKKLIDKVKKDNKKLPIFLFGHSMGSFISQEFIKKYGDSIKGVVLSGSAKTGLLHKLGNLMAKMCKGDLKEENHFLDGLSFGSYNKSFEPARTKFDWLSRDNKEVDKYVKDPLCGYCCTTGFFKEFLKGLASLNKNVKNIRKDLPIYAYCGTLDPVGTNSKDVVALVNMYKKNNIKDVQIKLYKDGRHEMHNEINKDEVVNDLVNWLDSHI